MRTHTLYAELTSLLRDLGFVCQPVKGSHVRCEHAPSRTLVLLADQPGTQTVPAAALAGVRRTLDERGVLGRDEFDRLLTEVAAAQDGEEAHPGQKQQEGVLEQES
jgi:predicted RNA binding protein YcfA (HicA-like mRNA interferase family)